MKKDTPQDTETPREPMYQLEEAILCSNAFIELILSKLVNILDEHEPLGQRSGDLAAGMTIMSFSIVENLTDAYTAAEKNWRETLPGAPRKLQAIS
jgi:hypothetical protein